MTIPFRKRSLDAERETRGAPNIWIGSPIEIPADEWVKVPTFTRPQKGASYDETMDYLEGWGAFTKRTERDVTPGANAGAYTIAQEQVVDIFDIGVQGYLSFFPEDGETVWLRSRFRYANGSSVSGEFDFDLGSNGVPEQEPLETPQATDPFRFLGSADRTTPYLVGPFSRNASVWIYSSSSTSVCWVPFSGSSTGLNVVAG